MNAFEYSREYLSALTDFTRANAKHARATLVFQAGFSTEEEYAKECKSYGEAEDAYDIALNAELERQKPTK